ncbi:MAG TPA: hypothetical protein VMK82_01005 [Steroidobacteraceae bacterium]|nr:hypothetical protein [Steroidobacteraceae bacterium]
MSMPLDSAERFADWSAPRRTSRNLASLTSDLLPVADFLCLLIAAWICAPLYAQWLTPVDLAPGHDSGFGRIALFVAALAPFILYDRLFGAIASRGDRRHLVRSFGLRFALLTGAVLVLGSLSAALENLSPYLLAAWFAISLLLTALTRVLAAHYLQRLRLLGTETAAFGAGPVADRLVMALRQIQPEAVEPLGMPDDQSRSPSSPRLALYPQWRPDAATDGHTPA